MNLVQFCIQLCDEAVITEIGRRNRKKFRNWLLSLRLCLTGRDRLKCLWPNLLRKLHCTSSLRKRTLIPVPRVQTYVVKFIAMTSTRGVKYSLLLIVDLNQEGKNCLLFSLESYISQ